MPVGGKVFNRDILLTKDAALYLGGTKFAYYDKVNDEVVIVADIQADPGSIGTAELADAAVTTAKIADDAVTSAKIADAANTQFTPAVITASGQGILAPSGSDQLNQDLVVFFLPPQITTAQILGVYFLSDTSTSSSDATSQYQFEVYNLTATESLSSASTNTADTEITGGQPYILTVDQNQTIDAGDVIVIRVDELDDGSPNPTDLSSANLNAFIIWRPLT